MSRLAELIAELCPDGVEYMQLGEISQVTMGTSPNGNTISSDPQNGIEFHQGKSCFGNILLGYSNIFTSLPIKVAEVGSIVMSVRAPVGDTNITERKIAIGRGLCAIVGKSPIETKFIYYCLNAFVNEIRKKSTGSTFDAINTDDVRSIKIPVPPLPVQEEIVRILDQFTELETQLDAELEAREKQYAYYRDALLDFSPGKPRIGSKHSRLNKLIETLCPNGVEIVPLDKVSKIERGQRVTKSKLSLTAKYPVISGGINPMGFLDYYNRDENTITVAQYGTAGFVNFQKQKFWANDVCYTIQVSPRLLNKYLYYFLRSKQDLIYSMKIDAVPAHLPLQRLESLSISIPPLEVQNDIVRILDQFDSLVNDIKQGLPAEKAARRKQYEYYRDELLTFKEKQA